MMIRGTRALLRWKAPPAVPKSQVSASLSSSPARAKLGLDARRHLPLTQRAFYAKSPYDKIDKAAEKKLAEQKLEARPEEVTTDSSTRQVFEPAPARPGQEASVNEGLKHDVGIVKETFQLQDVPKEPYFLGLAGTIPYLATSLTTVYLGWDLNTSWPTSSAFLNHLQLNQADAQSLLNLLEPIQLGYGAIILSFLGAVHWGMEYAEKTPLASRTRFRYGLGVAAPIIAWPTLLMPVEAALTSQFAAFTLMYMFDARATTRGWAPLWYQRYRFILTAIVGLAIFVSLVGRAKIGSAAPRIGQELSERMHKDLADKDTDWSALEAEEREKNRKKKAEEKKRKEKEEAAAKKKQAEEESKKNTKGTKAQASDSASEGEGEDANKDKQQSGEDNDESKQETGSEDKSSGNDVDKDEKDHSESKDDGKVEGKPEGKGDKSSDKNADEKK